MRSNITHLFLSAALALLVSCGGGGSGLEFEDVVGIPPSDGAGTALSGTYTVRFEVTSGGCDGSTSLNAPSDGTISTLEVEIVQDDGALTLDEIETQLQGSISFQNKFEVGGANLLDRGGFNNNILRTVLLSGEFQDANTFDGKGEERLSGRINDETFDCSFSFEVSGIRKV